MNECLLAIGAALFALSGFYNFLIENFCLGEIELSDKYSQNPQITDPIKKAKRRKKTERSGFFIIWAFGMLFTALAFFL